MNKSTPPTARCRRTPFDELECTIPFHPGLIDAWKKAIPYRYRGFDPDTKAWRFWGGYETVAASLLLDRFPGTEIPGRPGSYGNTQAQHASSNYFDTLHLKPTAPPELVDAAYRCLAKLHHPDKGGDPDIMRALTEAHHALARRLSA